MEPFDLLRAIMGYVLLDITSVLILYMILAEEELQLIFYKLIKIN